MKSQIAVVSFVALFVSAGAANSIELTNYDEDDKTITIIESGATAEAVLKAGESVKDICMSGCILQLGSNAEDQFEFQGNEIVSIEGNVVYDDTPVADDGTVDPDASGFGAEDSSQDEAISESEEPANNDEATQ